MSNQLEQYHFSQNNRYHNELNNTDVTYVNGIGAIFSFDYRQPLQLWQANQPATVVEKQPLTPELNNEKVKQQFNALRVQAKNLSHQAFSTERKIKSIKKSLKQLSGEQRIKREEQIALLEKELLLIENEKRLLKPKYDHAQALAEKAKTTTLPNEALAMTNNYIEDIESFIVNKLCDASDLASLLKLDDKIVFILKGAGQEQTLNEGFTHFQDINLTISLKSVLACQQDEISISELINSVTTDYF
ncbi:hypothetical protein [Thalassotalea ganghwensis]